MRERRKRAFRWIRVTLGMQQLEIAAHFDIPRRAWVSYEREGRAPNHELVARISEETGFPAAWILGEVEDDGIRCSDG